MKYKFQDLIDVAAVQRLTDLFHKATGMATAVIDLEGVVLTGSGWQGLCTDFHRVNPDARQRCVESDTVIANQVADGQKYTVYRCKNGLIDVATPITIEGEHVANFFTGQFLFKHADPEYFREQARRFGFDETAYMKAVAKVPVIEEARLQPFLEYFSEFAVMLGEMGLKQLKQMEEAAGLERYEMIAGHARDIILFLRREDGRILEANAAAAEAYGYSREELLSFTIHDLRAAETRTDATRQMADADDRGVLFETVHRRRDGTTFPVEVSSRGETIGGTRTLISVIRDVTERKSAESALRESEQRWATTLSSIGDAVIATDGLGRITFMNAVAEELTGWTLAEAAMKAVGEVFNIVNEQTRKAVDNPVARVLKEGTIVGLANHTVLIRKNGTEIPIDDSGAPIRDREGKTTGVVLVFRDITERKQAEERAHHLASFPELNPNPVLEVDASGGITFCNPGTFKALEELDVGEEECAGFLPDDLKAILENWDMKSEPVLHREASLKNRVFGETIHLVPRFKVARIYAYDMTEQKHAGERLLRSKEEWERTFASVPDMIAIIDNQHRVLRVNEAMAQRVGLSPDECVGLRCYEAVHGLNEPPDFCPHSRTLNDGRQHSEEVHEERLGGYFVVSTTPLKGEQGRMIGTVHVAHDVTERKHAEGALKKAYDELEIRVQERTVELQQAYDSLMQETREREQLEAQLRQAQKMEALGTMSGGIAHDFNNILAAIIGFAELLEGHVDKGSRNERHLKRILEASLRGRELVRQMLTFSRKTEQEKKPLLLSGIVRETARLIRASTPTTISIRVATKSESGVILGDPAQVQQILMNLCTNAVYAMQEKGGVLDVELSDFSVSSSSGNDHGMQPGLYMKLVVRDTGAGMPPEIIDRIFDPFFTTKKLGEGTGLGLSVVHGIVRQSNGYVTAESEPGKGSTFTVYFPKTTGEAETVDIGNESLPTGDERILFVDDEEALVEMGEDVLAELGYEVTSRTSSREALSLLKEDPSRFDLMITDQTMPGMTGIELAREILALRPDMPIIMCTGFSQLVDADKAKTAGVRAFAMKPLTKREIARTIRQVLDG